MRFPPTILQHRARLNPVVERAADALDAVATRAEDLQRQLLASAYGGDGSSALAAGYAVAAWSTLRELGDDRIQENAAGAQGVTGE
jgi:hypothetical protein